MFTRSTYAEALKFAGAVFIEKIFPQEVRKFLSALFLLVSIVLAIGIWVPHMSLGSLSVSVGALVSPNESLIEGSLYIAIAFFLFMFLISCFYNSFFFRGSEHVMHETQPPSRGSVTFEVAEMIMHAPQDLTRGFLASSYGKLLLERCNISFERALEYLNGSRALVSVDTLALPDKSYLSMKELADHIEHTDAEFMQFLFRNGITEDIYRGALEWVIRSIRNTKHNKRWWSRDNLGRVPSVGGDWSYGGAYTLERYSKDLGKQTVFSALSGSNAYAKEKVSQLETILARAKEANALIVGEEGVGKVDVITLLAKEISEGKALPPLIGKRILMLDTDAFIADHGTKERFEGEYLRMMHETERAGNIIVVLPNLPGFMASASSIGVDIVSLMDPFLASSAIQTIGLTDTGGFHSVIEAHSTLIERFERISMESADISSTIRVLEDIAEGYERKTGVLFTYSAIREVADSADRFITYGVMPDKAIDLLVEIVPAAEQYGATVITHDFVSGFVERKTGAPVGAVSDAERGKLLELEEILHRRVVGQKEAVDAVASTMRRARAGIQNPDRPVGSFLFLGPTGVGKTETAKALAEVFFGDEEKVTRFDMSEYNAEDSVGKLIGQFDSGQAGVLATALRERPYGVLLLDEFEKSSDSVKQLFLQVLDEGHFSDMRGKRVNAKNLIIIATSNAGSDTIWELVKQGKSLNESKDELIEQIIREGVYRPELINRFDGVIVFHPLQEEQLRAIAKIMLEKLKRRVMRQGYELVVNDVLIDLLVREGYNPHFGARPMNRVIQEVVEEKIARKVLEGTLKKGGKLEFSETDFES